MSFLKNLFNTRKETPASSYDALGIYAPVHGTVINPADLDDPVFSAQLMGPCLAVEPSDGKIYSPVVGTISMIYPTGHAFGVTTPQGAEILVHIGIDTVSLEGKGFKTFRKEGQSVSPADVVVSFDPDVVKKAGLSTSTMTIVTNAQDFGLEPLCKAGTQVQAGADLGRLKQSA